MTRRASFRLDTKTGVGFNLARIQIQLPLATLEGNYVSAPDTWRIQPGSLKYPLIIAHRGAHHRAPENTIPAFLEAVEMGVDAVELDVHLSSDGEVVVFHDRKLERASNGQGWINRHSLQQLRALALGYDPSHRIPTLDEVFDSLPPDYPVCVELKARIAGMKELPQQVAQVIERRRRWDTTLVHSFNPVSLYYVRHASPEATVGFIWARRHPYPLRARWLSPVANAHWSVPADATYNSRVLAHFHAQGKPVMAWDLDAGVDLEALGRSGLDAVVTDNPQRLIDQKPSRRPVAARA